MDWKELLNVPPGTALTVLDYAPHAFAGQECTLVSGGMEFSKICVAGTVEDWIDNSYIVILEEGSNGK